MRIILKKVLDNFDLIIMIILIYWYSHTQSNRQKSANVAHRQTFVFYLQIVVDKKHCSVL